jgi:hypothetical protein
MLSRGIVTIDCILRNWSALGCCCGAWGFREWGFLRLVFRGKAGRVWRSFFYNNQKSEVLLRKGFEVISLKSNLLL